MNCRWRQPPMRLTQKLKARRVDTKAITWQDHLGPRSAVFVSNATNVGPLTADEAEPLSLGMKKPRDLHREVSLNQANVPDAD